jgi:hypothetical protein
MGISKNVKFLFVFSCFISESRPPLWSGGQTLWLQGQRSRVQLPVVQDFLRNSGSGTASTQPRELEETLELKLAAPVYETDTNARGEPLL